MLGLYAACYCQLAHERQLQKTVTQTAWMGGVQGPQGILSFQVI